MVLMKELLLKRAENELILAENIKRMSEDSDTKTFMQIPQDMTFYSSVISHAYYAIFYCAKAYLTSKNISLKSKQGEHQQVYFEFKKLVNQGIIEQELLRIYEEVKNKAEILLEIFQLEKEKRGNFTYTTIPQANKEPADTSLNNAKFFVSHIMKLM